MAIARAVGAGGVGMADNDLTLIRNGIKAVIESVLPSPSNGGPTVYALSRSSMSVPFVLIRPVEGRRAAMKSLKRRYDFVLTLALGRGMDDANWEARMDDYLATNGSMSIEAAILSDKTLDGSAELVDVVEFSGYGEEIIVNGTEYAGAQILITVWGKEPT